MNTQENKQMPLSIYIPCVYCNTSKQFILETFRNMGLGEVSRIDFIKREINSLDNSISHPFNQAFVYFAYWNKNPIVEKLHKDILDPNQDARLFYDEPYYWRLLPNNNPRYDSPQTNDHDLRTVIMELQDKLDHQSNLITLMSQRIFDLSIAHNINSHKQTYEDSESESVGVLDESIETSEYKYDSPIIQSTIQPGTEVNLTTCGRRSEYPSHTAVVQEDSSDNSSVRGIGETKSDGSFDILNDNTD